MGNYVAEGVGHMAGDKAADGCGDSEWTKFWFVEWVFVEAEEVDISEVMFNGC
jgi:hypothetical protein